MWVLLAWPVCADSLDDRLVRAFDGWAAGNGASGSIATVERQADGRAVQGSGGVVFRSPLLRELASVSKSVTAVCALKLVQGGRLRWSDRLPDLLGEAPDVTVAELVTHSSGIAPDATQIVMGFWLDQDIPLFGHYADKVLEVVNARQQQQGVPGTYLYNNENYALLGLVIEAVSEQSFLEVCWPALDLTQDIWPSDRTMAMQPWGGLKANPLAYVDFLVRHYGPDSAIGRDPFALPHVEMGGGAYYGLGMVFREFGDSYNFWHFGALCFPDRLNVGSYAVLWEGRVGVLALYDACVDWDSMFALDAALTGAVYGGGQ